MKVIALVNQKGGVAKTTTAQALAYGLAYKGFKTLLIDFDPQASLTLACGAKIRKGTAFEWLALSPKMTESFENVVVNLMTNLDIVPATIELEEANIILGGKLGRELYLAKAIAPLDGRYDYVVIDSNPSLSLTTLNVLAAADELLIPFKPEYQSVQGVHLLLNTINDLKPINDVKVGGFIITMADNRRNSTSEAVDYINAFANTFNTTVYQSIIRQSTAIADAPSAQQCIFDFKPNSNAAVDYMSLVDEFIAKHETQQGD